MAALPHEQKTALEIHFDSQSDETSPQDSEAVINNSKYEEYGGALHEAKVAILAFGKFFTSSGRQQLSERREEKRARADELVRFIGEKILTPDLDPNDPRKIKPWSIHAQFIEDEDKKFKPNPYRPMTKKEKRRVNKLQSIHGKIAKIRSESNGFSKAYEIIISPNTKPVLTRGERIYYGKIGRKISRKENKIKKLDDKFHKVQYGKSHKSNTQN